MHLSRHRYGVSKFGFDTGRTLIFGVLPPILDKPSWFGARLKTGKGLHVHLCITDRPA